MSDNSRLRSVGCVIGFVALLWAARAPRSFAQEKRAAGTALPREMPAEVRDLFPVEKIPFSAPPPMMRVSETRCDPNGNIYLIYADAPEWAVRQPYASSTLPISKLSPGSKSITEYPVPPIQGYRGVLREDFDLGPDGRVYALLTALEESEGKGRPPAYFIAKYNDDGSMDSYFKLGAAPEGRIQPFRFAMFRDGSLLVAGTVVEGGQLRAFTAVMDRYGTFRTGIKLPPGVEAVPSDAGSSGGPEQAALGVTPAAGQGGARERKQQVAAGRWKTGPSPISLASNGYMISALDGNVYLLRGRDPASLYVISPAGEVVGRFEVLSPAPRLSPVNMARAGDDKVFIWFTHVATGAAGNEQPPDLISVLSLESGQVVAVYRLAAGESISNLVVCAASPYDFLFVGATDDGQHLQVTRYSPR